MRAACARELMKALGDTCVPCFTHAHRWRWKPSFSSRPSLDSVFPMVEGWLDSPLWEWTVEDLETSMSPEPNLSFPQSSRLEGVSSDLTTRDT